jgi:hypothetical protein
MYIAQVSIGYVIKRMPFTGPDHASQCDHYEPPAELSGLGQVNGSAIREQPETETTLLALDFSLSVGRNRKAGVWSDTEQESVRSDGTKLTMRGLLHYLLDEAGLTRWSPAMAGKRSWFIVRRELLGAAHAKITKGLALTSVIYIPETFAAERAAEIKQRQVQALARLAAAPNSRMILIGEVKSIEEARFGKALVVKHMPDLRLMMSEDLYTRLSNRFSQQLSLWGQLQLTHLLMIATISRSANGVYAVEAACLLNMSANWLPFETMYEWELMEKLHAEARRFTRGLRYNMAADKPLACAVLHDTGEASTALYVIPPAFEANYEAVIEALSEQSKLKAWKWRVGMGGSPALPAKAGAHHGQMQSDR